MRSAAIHEQLRQWLTGDPFPRTEDLPAPLQSRWIDAGSLPSTPLPDEEASAAASEEVQAFATVFGVAPEVAVPATFVWTDVVESAWARAGVRIVVTPGLRNESRDGEGRVVAGGRTYFNAATGPRGVSYVVRDCYLEPSLGHTHQRAIQALRSKTRAGRPTLIEIHRLNFMGDERALQHALDEVKLLLEAARADVPAVRFMSTAELARHCRERSPLVEQRWRVRVHFLIRRLAEVSRLRKLAWATGAALPALLAYVLTRPLHFSPVESS
jgi:hypothetical protein